MNAGPISGTGVRIANRGVADNDGDDYPAVGESSAHSVLPT